ncbi:13638_t:CDS:2, partial [Cetraspora pellucida]
SFNYIAALTLENCMTYRYIACGTIAEDPTFYASLCAPIVSGFSYNNEINHQNMNPLNVDEQNTEVIIESFQN